MVSRELFARGAGRPFQVVSILLAALLVATLASAQRRGVTPEDYFAFETVSDPRLSPDGKLVAYVVTTVDQKANRRHSSVWMAVADGARAPWPFTTSPQTANHPRWSPDGRSLAFLSARPAEGTANLRPQVHVLSLAGGEARRVTNLKNGVSDFQWSPDGSRLVCVSSSGPSDETPEGARRSDVRHYRHMNYKFNDTGWFDDKRSHLWVVDAASGAARQLTDGQDWTDTDPQWSPDGARIAFVSDRTGKAYDDSVNTDIWVIPAAGGPLTKISDQAGPDRSPRWSPDGRQIAYLGSVEEESQPQLWLAPGAGGGKSTLAAKGFDYFLSGLEWVEPGALYFDAGFHGTYRVYRVDLAAGSVTPVTAGERAIRAPSFHAGSRRMVYTADDFTHTGDLYIADADGRNERQLTRLNEALWKQLNVAAVERVPYKAADGWPLDGFLVKPVGWEAGKKYPLVLSVHGGPAGMYGVDWFHEFQVYAARGWAVFFCNPRGSTGYGYEFQRGIRGEWGGKDFTDIMSGVDAALARYPWIDRDRLGVTGGSYGGFMTNWIVGHTDRFKAAVTLRSVSNFISDDGTRDGAYGHRHDFGGDIFQQFDLYWDRSPLKYAKNVKTPTLVLHSDNDYRVPLEQGEQWFRALQHFGVPSEFVIFPRENHNLTRTGEPQHLVESLNWQCYWFDRYLNGNERARRPNE